jgi:hypothetical protein
MLPHYFCLVEFELRFEFNCLNLLGKKQNKTPLPFLFSAAQLPRFGGRPQTPPPPALRPISPTSPLSPSTKSLALHPLLLF